MDKDTSEIVKLTERISKDPKSKLFVPLAEEYKRRGTSRCPSMCSQKGLNTTPGTLQPNHSWEGCSSKRATLPVRKKSSKRS